MDFGTHDDIEISWNTDFWGPYVFDLSSKIPTGATIATCGAKVFEGKIKKSATYASPTLFVSLTDISDQVIEPDYSPQVVGDSDVYIKFQNPSGDYKKGEKCTLIITITLSGGGNRAFWFYAVALV